MRDLTLFAQSPVLGDRGHGGRQGCELDDDWSMLLGTIPVGPIDARIRDLIEMLPAGVYGCDRGGRISFFNRRAAELWGMEPRLNDDNHRYCGCYRIYMPDGTPIPPDETPMAKALHERRAVRNVEAEVERPDGSRFTASFSINPIYDEDGLVCGSINVLHDVSEQKRSEHQLRRAREELSEQLRDMERLHEISMRLMGTYDVMDILREVLHNVLAVNETGMGMLSLVDTAKGELSLGVSSGFSDEFLELIASTLPAGGPCTLACQERCRVIVADVLQDARFSNNLEAVRLGGFRAVHCTPLITREGKIIGVLSMHYKAPHVPDEREVRLTDLYARQAADLIDAAQLRQRLEAELAERARADEALRKSEQRHREILRGLAVACYTTDADGMLTFYNEAAAQLWGRRPELGMTRWCGSLRLFTTDGVELPLGQCPAALALQECRSVRGVEAVVERPDGTRRWFVPHPDPLFDADGRCTGIINVLVDVTEQRETRSDLERAKEAAEAANRSKDRFLAVLSHELRTPLSPVLMLAASLAEDAELPRSVREDMAMIRRNIELETKLIDDLLDLNRVTSGKLRLQLQPVDLNEELRHVAEICRSQFLEKSIHLECILDDMLPPLVADSARLQQVLWNVLKNAAKFTHPGGKVEVRTFAASSGRVAIQIRDNGIGIEPALLDKIFDAFEQGDPAVIQRSGGLGLGLAISKALIEMHQGVVWAESDGVGAGSVFTIELPAGVPEADRITLPTAVNGISSHRHLRLLLVEDHRDTARTLSRLLRSRGYSVHIAGNVASALDLFGRESFDLVISDIGLPDAPGYELMRQIRLRSETKAIAMSGYGMEADIEKSQQSGFSEHLVKPVSVLHLEQAIQRVCGRPIRTSAFHLSHR